MEKRGGHVRRQTHLIDESFKPEMTLKADEFGIKADIGPLPGVYSVYGLYEDDTFDYSLFGTNIPMETESRRSLYETRGKRSNTYVSALMNGLESLDSPVAETNNEENEIKSKTEGTEQELSEDEISIKDMEPKRPKVEEMQVNTSEKFILNAFDWSLVSSSTQNEDENALESLDMDEFGKCQRVNIKTGADENDLQMHLHIPRNAEKGVPSKMSPLILYFADAEKALFTFDGRKEKDRKEYFCTDGRKFIRDHCYVMSISEYKKTDFGKAIEPELMKRILKEIKHWFVPELITVIGHMKGAYLAIRMLMDNPGFSTNIVLNNPYLNIKKKEVIDKTLNEKWMEFLKLHENIKFMIGTTRKLDRIEEVTKPIKKCFRTQSEKKKDILKMITDKIELMTEISQCSPMGLVCYNYNAFIEKTEDKRLKEMDLTRYNAKIAKVIEL